MEQGFLSRNVFNEKSSVSSGQYCQVYPEFDKKDFGNHHFATDTLSFGDR
jgi:hypothetical protein